MNLKEQRTTNKRTKTPTRLLYFWYFQKTKKKYKLFFSVLCLDYKVGGTFIFAINPLSNLIQY